MQSLDVDALLPDVEKRIVQADDAAEKSPASAETKARFSESAAKGETTPLAKATGVATEVTSSPSKLEPDNSPRVTFDASRRPVGFQQAISAAIQNDVNVAIAAERVNEADAAKLNSVFGLLPRLSASGNYSRNYQRVLETDNAVFQAGEARFNTINASAEIRQPIFDLSRLFAVDAASIAKSGAVQSYLAASQLSAFTSSTAYLQALEAQTKIEFVKKRTALLDRQMRAERRLVAAGLSAPAGEDLVGLEKGALNVQRLEYEQDLANARSELSRVIGQSVDRVAPVKLPRKLLNSAGKKPWTQYATAAYRANPELLRLRIATLKSRRDYQQKLLKDALPTAEAFGRADYDDRDGSRFGGGSVTRDYVIGVEVKIPIFNATGEGYQSLESESKLRQNVLIEASQRRAIDSEMRAILQRLNTLRSNIRQADGAVSAARRLVKSANRGSQFGVSSDVLIMRQKLQLLQAEGWAAQARQEFLQSWVRLAYLTGEKVAF
ncbi:MAG: TolC family protein [Pseudomonadota bacterium]